MWSDAHLRDERVLVVPLTRRDGEVTVHLLQRAGMQCHVCVDVTRLHDELLLGAGAVILTDAALLHPGMRAVLDLIGGQPAWSDIPVLVLARDREESARLSDVMRSLTNATVLDRPTSTRSMLSAVLAAVRSRRRQYELRDQLVAQARAEAALRAADERKDEFLATLAHELRNPLAPLRTGLSLLEKSNDDPKRTTALHAMMDRQLVQLIKLIDELLDVSRISTGKVVLKQERVDLRGVVAIACEASQPAIDAAGHRLHVSVPDQPVWAFGDPFRLAQVINNLLNNAAKYTPNAGDITLVLAAQEGRAVVTVKDNGVGIPAEMLDTVFELFTQVRRTVDRSQGGLGIGLALVRKMMELHGGCVAATSDGPGCGSTFSIALPLLADEPVAGPPEAAPLAPAVTCDLRVLVVDDNRDAADTLTLLLQDKGLATRTAYNGFDAHASALQFLPDVVFCDIGMPGMSGNELATQLRLEDRLKSTVLVAVTGWGSEEDKRRSAAAGFDHHLTKPADLHAVDAILAKL